MHILGRAWVVGLLAVPACEEVVPFHAQSDFRAPDFEAPAQPMVPTDPDPPGWHTPYGAMTGTIHYDASLDGSRGCEARIDLAGRTYEGGCPSCTFAFSVEAELAHPVPDERCPLVPAWTMLSDGVVINPKLGFSPTYLGFEEVLWFGYGLDLTAYGYDLLEGPVWSLIHYDGFSGELEWDATSLSWDSALEFEYGYGSSPYFDLECIDDDSNPGDPVVDGVARMGTLPIDYRHMDVYDVAVEAGSVLRVGVDTVSAEDAFQPLIIVIAPDGCIVGANFSAHVCSFPPPQGQWCASTELVAHDAGTYRLVVEAIDGIASAAPIGAYRLGVAGAASEPVLVGDDELVYAEWRNLKLRVEMDLALEWW